MLLAVDIGNTSTALGLFSGEELIAHFRIHTDRMRMESEYRVILKNLFALEDLPPPKAALLASVVPPVEREMKRAIERLFGVEARVGEAADTGLEVLIDNPREAGADRLVNAVGALAYPSPTGRYIVVDFGTATTVTVVAEELWIMAVMPRPVRKPTNTRLVILSSRVRSLPPARRSRAWPIRFMPNRNRHSPPTSVSALKIVIDVTPSIRRFYILTHALLHFSVYRAFVKSVVMSK